MNSMKINYGIIGNPVAHSLSPDMHNAAFKRLKLSGKYKKIHLQESQLKSFLKKLRCSGYQGLNITVPFKEKVLPFLDKISPEAKLIGAVNTILVKNGKIIGYNTDGAGYLLSLQKEKKWQAKNKKIVILGAGGAARGILAALCLAQAKQITIANRREMKSQKLAQDFKRKFPKTKLQSCSLLNIGNDLKNADLFINTTSGGMKGNELPSLPLEKLPRKALVSDIVYKPRKTALLQNARKLKLKTHEGLGMLLYQGALAFEIWTGKKAPVALMKRALLKKLKGTS